MTSPHCSAETFFFQMFNVCLNTVGGSLNFSWGLFVSSSTGDRFFLKALFSSACRHHPLVLVLVLLLLLLHELSFSVCLQIVGYSRVPPWLALLTQAWTLSTRAAPCRCFLPPPTCWWLSNLYFQTTSSPQISKLQLPLLGHFTDRTSSYPKLTCSSSL